MHITTNKSLNPTHGEMYSVQYYVIVCQWFSPRTPVSSNKTDRHDITEILLKVVLKHYKPNPIVISLQLPSSEDDIEGN